MESFAVLGIFVILMTISYAPDFLEGVTLNGYDWATIVTVCTTVFFCVALPATEHAQMIASYTTMMILTVAWYIAYTTQTPTT